MVVVGALVWRLATPTDSNVHSTLEGHKVPDFSLPPIIPNTPSLSSQDLATGKPHLVNIFASWCVPCVSEIAVLQMLQHDGVRIEGIAIRDRPQDLSVFLAHNGDPYERIGSDAQSAVQISLGSSGVPESFVVDGKGVIRYQQIGPIEVSDIPLIQNKLEQAQ